MRLQRLPYLYYKYKMYKLFFVVLLYINNAHCCSNIYEQCGGLNYAGETCCISGCNCMKQNDYYSQCLPVHENYVDCEQSYYVCTSSGKSCDECQNIYDNCVKNPSAPSPSTIDQSKTKSSMPSLMPSMVVITPTLTPSTIETSSPQSASTSCLSVGEWTSDSNQLLLNNQIFKLKGINWFGFETSNNVVHGLWATSMDALLDFIADNNFNAMRIPISLDFALQPSAAITGCNAALNGDICSKSGWEVLYILFEKAAERSIYILLDMHALNRDNRNGLWYIAGGTYDEKHLINGWIAILKEFGKAANLMGIDLYNEPHDATWGTGNIQTDWDLAVKRITSAIYSEIPDFNGLIFVEGVAAMTINNPCINAATNGYNWGANLAGICAHPLDFIGNKLVYSPHIYGPNVAQQSYFTANNYTNNLPDVYNKQIGYLSTVTKAAIVLGEWGSIYTGNDKTWADSFADYLLTAGFTNTFFWSLNSDSADTGGLVKDDWKTPETDKLALVAKVQPHPTKSC